MNVSHIPLNIKITVINVTVHERKNHSTTHPRNINRTDIIPFVSSNIAFDFYFLAHPLTSTFTFNVSAPISSLYLEEMPSSSFNLYVLPQISSLIPFIFCLQLTV